MLRDYDVRHFYVLNILMLINKLQHMIPVLPSVAPLLNRMITDEVGTVCQALSFCQFVTSGLTSKMSFLHDLDPQKWYLKLTVGVTSCELRDQMVYWKNGLGSSVCLSLHLVTNSENTSSMQVMYAKDSYFSNTHGSIPAHQSETNKIVRK